MYEVVKRKTYENGTKLVVIDWGGTFTAELGKTKDSGIEIEFRWRYEAKSHQSVMVWVNKVMKNPLPHKFYENGIYHLPHNSGFGNISGKRMVCID